MCPIPPEGGLRSVGIHGSDRARLGHLWFVPPRSLRQTLADAPPTHAGLRKKNTTAQPLSFEEQIQRANSGQADLFGNTDAVVKYVLEGHDRGVNWATFHPTLPLIVSCGDDRQIKLWRMSETKAWEVDTCRGHFNNVSVALFHPKHELIISDSEDKTIRVWDMSKRTAVQTFRRENDRFWVLTAHPELNLFAAGPSLFLTSFRGSWELTALSPFPRPRLGTHRLQARPRATGVQHSRQHPLLRPGQVRPRPRPHYRLRHGRHLRPSPRESVRPTENAQLQPRRARRDRHFGTLCACSRVSLQLTLFAIQPADNGLYELVHLPKDMGSGEVRDSASEGKRGVGSSAIFVARNRFAVLDKVAQTIEIRDLDNAITKTIKCPVQPNDIFYGGTASVLLSCPASVVLFDIQQQKIIAELATPLVKYAVWSADNSMVALLSKHSASRPLPRSGVVEELTRPVCSHHDRQQEPRAECHGSRDDSDQVGCLGRQRHLHLLDPQPHQIRPSPRVRPFRVLSSCPRLTFPSSFSDNGIIKTLDQPVYLTRVKGKVVHCLDRNAKPRSIPIDPTEYRFKLALMRKNYDEVLHIIRTSNLVGQSIIAYLQKKGFPEVRAPDFGSSGSEN